MKATVLKDFRDKNNFAKLYKVGDDVSNLPKGRIEELKRKGLIEVEKPKAEPKGEGKRQSPKAETDEIKEVIDIKDNIN